MKIFKKKIDCDFLWSKTKLSFLTKGLFVAMLLIASLGCKRANETALKSDHEATTKKTNADETFYIAVLPDTQYYTDPGGSHNGSMSMFTNQIDWIIANKTSLNIQYVAHLGDITDNGDRPGHAYEWINAKNELYRLDSAAIRYGLAVGNHDQWCYGDPGSGATNDGYGLWFGKSHFTGYSWYGGAYGSSNNNDNHYDRFTVFGQKYLVMFIEFNEKGYSPATGDCAGQEHYSSTIENNVKNWANSIIAANSDHKVIIVSHSVLKPHSTGVSSHDNKHKTLLDQAPDNDPGKFTTQGQYIYDNIAKPNQNVFMMLGGHITGEGYRVENQNGHVVKAFLSDYQYRPNGGDGYMRIMKFNKTQGTIDVRTIQPLPGPNNEEMDADSKFTVSMFN